MNLNEYREWEFREYKLRVGCQVAKSDVLYKFIPRLENLLKKDSHFKMKYIVDGEHPTIEDLRMICSLDIDLENLIPSRLWMHIEPEISNHFENFDWDSFWFSDLNEEERRC